MKRTKLVLDFSRDIAVVFDESIKLMCTSTGHFCIPLTHMLLTNNNPKIFVLHTSALKNLSITKKKKKKERATKLHRQFAHASKEKLCKLVKENKDFDDFKMIEECCNSCDIYMEFKHPSLHPIVGLPLASRFNQVVCMDLKEHVHNESWMLHLIDSVTRYTAAYMIKMKNREMIIKKSL